MLISNSQIKIIFLFPNEYRLAYHFSNLLEIEDRSVRMAASQALAVFKIDDLEDFSCDAIQTLKEKIIDQVEAFST